MKPACLGVYLALAFVALTGCVDDSEKFTLGEPSLTILATGNCGRNSAPVLEDSTGSVTVTVTGRDPRTPTGNMRAGTTVRLAFADESDLAKAYFKSSATSTELITDSADLPFSGARARDEVLCFQEGTVSVVATITEYSVSAQGDEARTVELTTGPFPIRCLSTIDYNRECSGLPLIDAGADMAVDAGDIGVDGGDAARPPAYSIRFLPPTSESDLVIGIKDSAFGRPDNVLLRFQVVDLNETSSEGGDALANLPVRFRLSPNPPPNVAIEPTMAQTDDEGVVTVRLLAGGTPGVVSVEAETSISDGASLTARSATIVIRGGIPSASGFQFLCEDPVISAFTARPAWDHYIFGLGQNDSTNCIAQLSDRVTGRVDIATQVFFISEAGSVDQATATDESGVAVTSLRIGPPAPYEIVDITPGSYEPTADERFVTTPYNPRDGLVTVVAVTRGEEDFVDVNGNKVWDPDQDYQLSHMDLAEPCIDADDDGECRIDLPVRGEDDYAEVFRDTNNDGVWSEGNGEWDKDTEIWKATHVLWVGQMDLERSRFAFLCESNAGCFQNQNGAGVSDLCRIPGVPDSEHSFFFAPGGRLTIEARFNDSNGNCLDAYGEGSTYIEVDGSLEETANRTEQQFVGDCFAGSLPTQPLAPTHFYQVVDTSDAEADEAQFGTIRLGVRYRTIGGAQRDDSIILRTCR